MIDSFPFKVGARKGIWEWIFGNWFCFWLCDSVGCVMSHNAKESFWLSFNSFVEVAIGKLCRNNVDPIIYFFFGIEI